jgi:hypothetical protein
MWRAVMGSTVRVACLDAGLDDLDTFDNLDSFNSVDDPKSLGSSDSEVVHLCWNSPCQVCQVW